MLELIQQRFQTVVLLLIVLGLSAVFILQFGGPQARGCTQSLNETNYAARVYGETITEGDFRASYTVTNFSRYPTKQARTLRLRELTLDGLVERELLAHEAERIGFRADPDEVMREFVETGVIYRNPPVDAPEGYPATELPAIDFEGEDGQFSSKNMRRYINNHLRRSSEEFTHWQVRERLAARMRDAIAAQVTISPEEIHDQYVRDTERARLSYVQFRESWFQDQVDANETAVRAWMTEHQSQVDETYTQQRHRYTGLEPQVRARHILIKASESAPEADRTAARTRAEELLHRAQAGEDFAALARQYSEDEGSGRQGGDLGWNGHGRMVAPFDEAMFATETGHITDHLVETQFGYHVIEVTGHREGDVPEDEAKLEIATDLYRSARASELAHEQATRALTYLRDGHTMAELDERLLHNWAETPAPAPAADGTTPPAEPAPAPEDTTERDPSAPQVRDTHSFGHTDTPVSGAFDAGPLTRAAFSMSLEHPLPEEPLQLGDDWFVFQLTERTLATPEGFTEEVRDRIRNSLLVTKREEAVRAFVHQLRERAIASGDLRTDDSVLLYGDEATEDGEDGEGGSRGGSRGSDSEHEGEEESALDRRLLDLPT
jgi:peptidyl-prolyl cis-trans isomerase D